MKLLTLAIGEDFRKSLTKALDSKKRYCEKRGYEYVLGDEKFWDREKPIPWSKIPFLLDVLKNSSDGEFIFMSDADVYITNMDFDIEKSIVPLLPENKDLLMTIDSCGHINDGNILVDETKNDKIYLIDFGLASFMMNQKRIHQRTTYFYNDNDCTAFDDFFAICTLLANYNKELFKIIYHLLKILIINFRNPKINEIDKIDTPFSFYLNQTEEDSYDKLHNLEIYNKYNMIKIYDLVKIYLL